MILKMDNNYLDKVIDQIVSDTSIEHAEEMLYTPFSPSFYPLSLNFSLTPIHFSHHCKNIYGLNEREIKYVWKEYRNIIKDKINNG